MNVGVGAMAGWTLQKSLLSIAVVLAGLAGMAPAAAQWKWMDKNRQVQYSDIPPPLDTPDRDILQRPRPATALAASAAPAAATAAASSASTAAQARQVEPELEARRRKTEQDTAARAKAEARTEEERVTAMRNENCNRARADVRTLDDGGRLARSNVRGEREILDDRQRADELRRTRDLIAALCR